MRGHTENDASDVVLAKSKSILIVIKKIENGIWYYKSLACPREPPPKLHIAFLREIHAIIAEQPCRIIISVTPYLLLLYGSQLS